MSYAEKLSAALERASHPRSIINIQTVYEAAAARGIMDAEPGENVLTFNAWRAKGRTVRRGEKALCKLAVFYTRDIRNTETGDTETIKRPGSAAVFHVSQTEPWSGKQS